MSTKKQNKTILVAIFCVLMLNAITLVGCVNKKQSDNTQQIIPAYTQMEYNGISWEVTYNITDKTVLSISANYSEIDRNSLYYQQFAHKHGDNTAYAKHNITLNGEPIGDNWFLITKTEVITDGWTDEIYFNSTTRYEEQILFDLS